MKNHIFAWACRDQPASTSMASRRIFLLSNLHLLPNSTDAKCLHKGKPNFGPPKIACLKYWGLKEGWKTMPIFMQIGMVRSCPFSLMLQTSNECHQDRHLDSVQILTLGACKGRAKITCVNNKHSLHANGFCQYGGLFIVLHTISILPLSSSIADVLSGTDNQCWPRWGHALSPLGYGDENRGTATVSQPKCVSFENGLIHPTCNWSKHGGPIFSPFS